MAFLTGFGPLQWGMVAAAAVAIFLIFKGQDIYKYAMTPKAPVAPPPPVEIDPDVLDMLALKRLTLRYTRLNCPEGTTAMQTAAQHFFHGTTGV